MRSSVGRWIKRGFQVVGGLLFLLALLIVAFVGPWPAYKETRYRESRSFRQTLSKIDENLAESQITESPGRLRAGWASRCITPPVGTPMAGYSARPFEKRSQGARDDLFVKAVAISDGKDTVVLLGSDMLMTTLNVAQAVWEKVKEETALGPNDILFTTSHTHNGPGGFAPGLLAEYSAGEYDPEIPEMISDAMAEAILEAVDSLAPAKLAYHHVDAPEYIRNRVHDGPTDSLLRFLVLQQETGDFCFVVRYSAHPTNFKEEDMELSAEYPGELVRFLQREANAEAVYLGGAVGAMGPRPPEGKDASIRVQLMGEALGKKVLNHLKGVYFQTHLDVASVGVAFDMPPMQVRPFSASWRLSPLLAHVVGLPTEAWIQAIRVGDLIFLGLPYDAGGEVARKWAEQAAFQGWEMWITSHCVAYCGYLSPDKYYWSDLEEDNYDMFYEFRLMNWFGPDQEAMFADLKDHILKRISSEHNLTRRAIP